MQTQLAGLTVFITGASGGIGQALAEKFGQEGANLVLHAGTNLTALNQFVEGKEWSQRALCAACDVRDPAQLQGIVDAGVQRFGRVDICIVNAGIWPAETLVLNETPEEVIRRTLDVNLLGAIFTAQAFMKALAVTGPRSDHRGASICFIGSTAGRFGEARHSVYSATKAAMHGLMRSLKNEIVTLDPYARVNTVEPGWTVTPMAEEQLKVPGVVEKINATMALRQLARADDIASAVLFFSAPGLSRHVSGEVMTVAGGMEGRSLWKPEEVDATAVRQRLSEP